MVPTIRPGDRLHGRLTPGGEPCPRFSIVEFRAEAVEVDVPFVVDVSGFATHIDDHLGALQAGENVAEVVKGREARIRRRTNTLPWS